MHMMKPARGKLEFAQARAMTTTTTTNNSNKMTDETKMICLATGSFSRDSMRSLIRPLGLSEYPRPRIEYICRIGHENQGWWFVNY